MPSSQAQSRRKVALLRELGKLLDVAGTTTQWPILARALRRLNTAELTALHYRVERSLATSYEDGAEYSARLLAGSASG